MSRLLQILAVCGLVLLFNASQVKAEVTAAIHATGQAEARLAPDMATLELSVAREAKTAREALDANSAAMGRVIAAMRDQGVADGDLQTSNFSIQPRYVYPSNRSEKPPQLVGYRVRNSLTVVVRDLDQLGALLDKSVSLGVNEGGNVSFGNTDPSAAIDKARAAAVKDALRRAGTMAEAAGVKLGDILSLSEQSGMSHPRPIPMARMAAAEADSVPMVAGENSYQVTVQLSIAIDQ
ncbi:hypothetical protein BST95_14060 [Halioglobus japonicus]|uniref:SIMPL domain-containing protein n=1 Tax=Halioglobus japonicus TaxID=930805 RepID=A0AAP8SPN0_9GAMM|nr:SIMPL domain-containing protein [Halioglobus japonicus]AQA19198.1 hypothetical protein BST95_14060 [Halioglobus japonicus]PLW87766.1 SIMPL domain-containing protein [Halioglobus japonicus]GHD06682.1 SIMPL domain-containing protein [Halioglobus japonicus]